jgi:hypothetical protein
MWRLNLGQRRLTLEPKKLSLNPFWPVLGLERVTLEYWRVTQEQRKLSLGQ